MPLQINKVITMGILWEVYDLSLYNIICTFNVVIIIATVCIKLSTYYHKRMKEMIGMITM